MLKYSKTTPSVLQQDHGPLSYSKTTALCPTARPPPSVLQQDPMPSVLQQDHGPLSYSKTPSPLSYSKTTPSFLPDQALCSTEPRPLSYRTTALCPTGPRPSVLQDHALCPTARPQPSVLLNHALCPTGPRPLSYRTTALCPTGPRPLSYRTLGGRSGLPEPVDRRLRLTERKVEEDDHLLPPGHRPSVLWRCP